MSTPAKRPTVGGKTTGGKRSADKVAGASVSAGRSVPKAIRSGAQVNAKGSGPSGAGRGVAGSVSVLAPKQVRAMTRVLLDSDPEEVARVVAAVELQDSSHDLDPVLWGGAPRATEVLSAELANLRKEFSARKELEGRSLSRADVADLLGTSGQSVTDALESRRLLGFRRGRRWLIPAWQLDAEAERGVLPGLGEVQLAFPGGVVALSAWVSKASVDLAGASPREALARGQVAEVIEVARNLTAAG
jgi:hypothetical protein